MDREQACNYLRSSGFSEEQIRTIEGAFTCEDCVSRQAVIKHICEEKFCYEENCKGVLFNRCPDITWVNELPSVTPQPKTGHCKDCKYFEYDSVAKVDGVPLIVAHEICSKWGDGCKTSEDGYCFLFESKERSDKS